jgi:DNA-binding NtrC family response regulator
VLNIELPSLRRRREDIRPIVEHYVAELAARLGKPFLGLEDRAWVLLESYRWPGNVRELLQSLERALIRSDSGLLRPEHFQITASASEPDSSTGGSGRSTAPEITMEGITAAGKGDHSPQTLAEVERRAIIQALSFAKGNRNRAAEILAIHRNTLRKKMQEYQIET